MTANATSRAEQDGPTQAAEAATRTRPEEPEETLRHTGQAVTDVDTEPSSTPRPARGPQGLTPDDKRAAAGDSDGTDASETASAVSTHGTAEETVGPGVERSADAVTSVTEAEPATPVRAEQSSGTAGDSTVPDAVDSGARDSSADQAAEPLATTATRPTKLLGTHDDRAKEPDKQAVPVTPGGKASDGTRADAGALAGVEECEEAPDVSLEALGSVATPTESLPGMVVPGSPAGTPAGPVSGTSPDREAAGTGSGRDIPVERLEDPGNSATEGGTGRPGVAEKTLEQALPSAPADEPLKGLAELTGAPQRLRAVRRDGLRRVGIATELVALLAVVFCAVQVLRPLPGPALVMTGAPSYTIAGAPLTPAWPGEGEAAVELEGVGSLGTYGDQKPIPTGSMAKVMTAYYSSATS
ncbi:hypothetical protein ACIG5E_38255 [Kitasatospora sp. NPDC053057]|uniref:hypothetical protein n=1 Tax=Kitasatospora sp. NPDC053057 TaxID=3364062 RepID=UPI0037C73153